MQERGRVGIQALFFLDAIMRNALADHKGDPELMGYPKLHFGVSQCEETSSG